MLTHDLRLAPRDHAQVLVARRLRDHLQLRPWLLQAACRWLMARAYAATTLECILDGHLLPIADEAGAAGAKVYDVIDRNIRLYVGRLCL